MKTRKKRLLSILTCVAMLVAIVPMNVFASETDGVAKYYEVSASNKTNSTKKHETQEGSDYYYYEVLAHTFQDVGDTSTVIINDFADTTYTSSNYFKGFELYYMDADIFAGMKEAINYGDISSMNNYLGFSGTFTDLVTLDSNSAAKDYKYAIEINGNLYSIVDKKLVAITTPVALPMRQNSNDTTKSDDCGLTFRLDEYNAILGTSLETTLTASSTMPDWTQAKLDKVNFVLYKNGSLVEKLNFADLYTAPVYNVGAPQYINTFKLNADGSVTLSSSAMLTLYGCSKGSTTWHAVPKSYNDVDKTNTVDKDIIAGLDNLIILTTGTNHVFYTVLDITNISAIFEYYKASNINPDNITDSEKPGNTTEDEKPSNGLIIEVPKDETTTGNKENTTVGNKEDETTCNNEETTVDDTSTENKEDTSTEIKDVTLTEDNKVVSKDDMSTLITENATKDVVIKTPAGITLTFAKGTMKVVDGKDTYDFGVSISDDYSKQSDMGAVTKDNFVSLIDFEYSGNLPAEATIKIPVGADRAGQTLYYLLKTDTGYTLIQSAKVDDEGYITVKQDHCSTYVITTVDVSEKATVDKNDETTADKNNETVPETETKKDTDTKKSDKDNNAVIYIVIAVIVVAVIAGVVVFVIYKKRKNETIEDITEDSIEETTENKTEE